MKKKSKSYVGVFLLAIFVPILIVTFILLTNKKTDSPEQLTNNETSQEPAPMVAPEPVNKTYENNAFSFKYSPQFEMHEASDSAISWIDSTANFSMELVWQSKPFSKVLEVKRELNTKDIKIAQDKEMVVSTNKVRDIVYDCGQDGLYHELQIQSGDNFYRLRASTAGGHEPKFQQIIASLKFIN